MALNTTFTSGQILTAAQVNNLPMGTVSAPVSLTALNFNPVAAADIAGATITFTAVANRIYRVTYCFFANCTGADSSLNITFTDTTPTVIQQSLFTFSTPFNPEGRQCTSVFYFTAGSSGSITRKLRAQRQTGASTLTIFSNSTLPFQYAIEDVGSV